MSSTLALLFGNYADKRELQKVFDSNLIVMPPADQPLVEGGDFWFDYTADVGDGFEATYTVAALLAQPTLRVEGIDGELPRGQMLVLGGDEVYPTASSKAYEDRTTGPLPLGDALRVAAAAAARPAGQPRLVRRPHGVPAPVHPGPDDRRLAHRAEAQLLDRAAAAPLVAGRARQPARLLLRRPAAQVLRVDADRQPPAGRQRHRVRGHRRPGSRRRRAIPTRSTAWSGSSATSSPPGRIPGTDGAGAHRRRRRGSGSAATSTTTCATPSASRTRRPPSGTARQMVTAGIGGAYLDVTHGLATELKLLPQASRNWREGDSDATFEQQPVCYPSLDGLTGAGSTAARQAVGQGVAASRRNPGVFTAVALTHFTIFLLMLLIFWQGDPGQRDRPDHRRLPVGHAERAGQVRRRAARRGAARLRHLPAAAGARPTTAARGQGDGPDLRPAAGGLHLLRRLRPAAGRHPRPARRLAEVLRGDHRGVGGRRRARRVRDRRVDRRLHAPGPDVLGDDGPGDRGGEGLPPHPPRRRRRADGATRSSPRSWSRLRHHAPSRW